MVVSMSSTRLAYDELASPHEMYADAEAVGARLRLDPLDEAVRAAVQPAPSIRYEDYPREIAKTELRVSDTARRLANALHLHLD